jgi:hypothetical protein
MLRLRALLHWTQIPIFDPAKQKAPAWRTGVVRLPRRPHLPSAKDVTETVWAVVLALRFSGLQLRDSAGLQRSFSVAPASPLRPLIREKGAHSVRAILFVSPFYISFEYMQGISPFLDACAVQLHRAA